MLSVSLLQKTVQLKTSTQLKVHISIHTDASSYSVDTVQTVLHGVINLGAFAEVQGT